MARSILRSMRDDIYLVVGSILARRGQADSAERIYERVAGMVVPLGRGCAIAYAEPLIESVTPGNPTVADSGAAEQGKAEFDGLRELFEAQNQHLAQARAAGVDEELGPDELQQLAEVHLRDQDLLVAAQHVARVPRERVEVTQVELGHVVPGAAHLAAGGADGAVRRPPAEDEHLGAAVGRPRRQPRSAGGEADGPVAVATYERAE